MIKRARENAKKKNLRPPHVAFVEAGLTQPLPIASDSIDCVLSNCVINLLPSDGKAKLFKEVFRVLKPGGRLCADDVSTLAIDEESLFIPDIWQIIAKQILPDAIRNDLASYVGCIAGAIQIDQYRDLIMGAGLQGGFL